MSYNKALQLIRSSRGAVISGDTITIIDVLTGEEDRAISYLVARGYKVEHNLSAIVEGIR